MTFAERILGRQPFRTTIMGLPLHFKFDKELCEAADVHGISKENGQIVLDPSINDNMLLDTACHEIIHVAQMRHDWRITHKMISSLGNLFGQVLEWEG
jgi:hypothetical protein